MPASDSDEDQGTLRLDGVLREQEEYMLARLGEKYGLEPEVRAPAIAMQWIVLCHQPQSPRALAMTWGVPHSEQL